MCAVIVIVVARVKVISGKRCAEAAAAPSCALVCVCVWRERERRWEMCFSGLDAARFSGFYLTLLLPYRNMQHVESTNCILAQSLSR